VLAKRIFDLIVVMALLPILLIVFLVIYFVVRIKIGKPVLFIQERPGYLGKPFKLYKYRTMTNERDKDRNLMPDHARITQLGKVIRSSSLDELPEIINVLKGEMSIVGPRPLLIQYLALYTKEQSRRHEVKPGITGWAQINGRNAISWEEKFSHDVWYVDNHSILLDIKIILITIWKVILRKDINQEGSATMEGFKGS
jgi:sugar transferase EpsL